MADATAAPAAPAAQQSSEQNTPNQAPKPTGQATNGAKGQSQQPSQAPAAPQGGIAQARAKLEGQKPAPKAPQQAESPWDDASEAQLWELMKRAPHFKVKAGGRELAIDSKEAWEQHGKRSIERVQGINALTESAKKQLEQAKGIESKHAEVERILERARQGDEQAIRALGILHPIERQEQQKFLEGLDPTTRAIAEENQRLHAERAQREQAVAQQREEAAKAQLLGQAKGLAGEIAQALTGEDGKLSPDLLFHAVQHMDLVHRAGLRLNIDYTVDDVRDYAREQFEAQGIKRTLAMGAERMAPHVAPVLAEAGFEAFAANLPPEKAIAFAQQASRWVLKQLRGGGGAGQPAPSPLAQQSPVVGQQPKPQQTNGTPRPMLRRFGY
jgi:hypothetical protein